MEGKKKVRIKIIAFCFQPYTIQMPAKIGICVSKQCMLGKRQGLAEKLEHKLNKNTKRYDYVHVPDMSFMGC